MKASIAFGVLYHTITFFIVLAAIFHVIPCVLFEIISIDKIFARVVRRVNVNHLDLAKICFLQELQHFQIVALDIEVLTVKTAGCAILANAVSHHRAQRCRDGRICRQRCLFLVRPCELIALLPTFYNGIGKFLPQNVKVNGVLYFTVAFHLGNGVGE